MLHMHMHHADLRGVGGGRANDGGRANVGGHAKRPVAVPTPFNVWQKRLRRGGVRKPGGGRTKMGGGRTNPGRCTHQKGRWTYRLPFRLTKQPTLLLAPWVAAMVHQELA